MKTNVLLIVFLALTMPICAQWNSMDIFFDNLIQTQPVQTEVDFDIEEGFFIKNYKKNVQFNPGGNPVLFMNIPYQGYKGVDFDGNTWLTVPDMDNIDIDANSDWFRVTFHFKSDASNKAINTILDKRDENGIGYHVCLYYGRPLIQIGTENGFDNYWPGFEGTNYSDNEWHRVYIQVDRANPDNSYMWVDNPHHDAVVCRFDATKHKNLDLSNNSDLYIGKHKNLQSSNFEGSLEHLHIGIQR